MEINIDYSKGSLTFRDYARQFEALPVALRADAMQKAAVGGAKLIAATVKHDIPIGHAPVPRRLGRGKIRRRRTRDTVTVLRGKALRRKRAQADNEIGAYVSVYAGAYLLEFGTKYLAPRHYLSRAADKRTGDIPRVYERAIRNQLRTVARQLRSGKLTRKVGRALADYATEPLP